MHIPVGVLDFQANFEAVSVCDTHTHTHTHTHQGENCAEFGQNNPEVQLITLPCY